jgi:hypothetical protein
MWLQYGNACLHFGPEINDVDFAELALAVCRHGHQWLRLWPREGAGTPVQLTDETKLSIEQCKLLINVSENPETVRSAVGQLLRRPPSHIRAVAIISKNASPN